MSVADVLKKIGDWTTAAKLANIVAKEYGIAEETAYRKMKNEVEDGLIRRIPLPDRSVVYGLPNWPLKEDDIRLMIDALNAFSLSQLAHAAQIEALAKFIEATRESKADL